MTVDSFYYPVVYDNDGGIEYTFELESVGSVAMQIYKNDGTTRTLLTEDYHYTLEFEEHLDPIFTRGTVTLAAPIAPGAWLEIFRYTPRSTLYEATAQEPFLVEQFEYALDKVCYIQQELEGILCACPQYPELPEEPEQPPVEPPPPPVLVCKYYDCDAWRIEAFLAGADNVWPMDDGDRYPIGPQDRLYKHPESTGSEEMLIIPDPDGATWANTIAAKRVPTSTIASAYEPCQEYYIRYEVGGGLITTFGWVPEPKPNTIGPGPLINFAAVFLNVGFNLGQMNQQTQRLYRTLAGGTYSWTTIGFQWDIIDQGDGNHLFRFRVEGGNNFVGNMLIPSTEMNAPDTPVYCGVFFSFRDFTNGGDAGGGNVYVNINYDYYVRINDHVTQGVYTTQEVNKAANIASYNWNAGPGNNLTYYHVYRAGSFDCVAMASRESTTDYAWIDNAYTGFQRTFLGYENCVPIEPN